MIVHNLVFSDKIFIVGNALMLVNAVHFMGKIMLLASQRGKAFAITYTIDKLIKNGLTIYTSFT